MTGYTFQPGTDNSLRKKMNGQNMLGPTTQQVLKVLSLRMPSVLGGAPIAPGELMQPKVGGGTGSSSAVAQTQQAQPSAPGGVTSQEAPPTSMYGGSVKPQEPEVPKWSAGPVSKMPMASPVSTAPAGNEMAQLVELITQILTPQVPTFTPGQDQGQRADLNAGVAPLGDVIVEGLKPPAASPTFSSNNGASFWRDWLRRGGGDF